MLLRHRAAGRSQTRRLLRAELSHQSVHLRFAGLVQCTTQRHYRFVKVDAAGGYVDGDTLAALEAGGWSGYAALQNNDSYHALKAVDGLIITGATGTNVNDVAVALIGKKTPPVSPEVSPEW